MRQGDIISPKLFKACLEEVFQKLSCYVKGIKIDGEYLNRFRFADDIVLIIDNVEDLQEIINEPYKASKAVGLHMNFKKLQVMANRRVNRDSEIKVDNEILQKVTHYNYLGQHISTSPSIEKVIKRRIRLGWSAFRRASSTFKSNIAMILKRKVYNQCIQPTVTYDLETWNIAKSLSYKLRAMQLPQARIMINITWRDKKLAEWIINQTYP